MKELRDVISRHKKNIADLEKELEKIETDAKNNIEELSEKDKNLSVDQLTNKLKRFGELTKIYRKNYKNLLEKLRARSVSSQEDKEQLNELEELDELEKNKDKIKSLKTLKEIYEGTHKDKKRLNELKKTRIKLSLNCKHLSQYEYGLQISRLLRLKQLGATSVATNINDKQYLLYLKEIAMTGLLSTKESLEADLNDPAAVYRENREETTKALLEWKKVVEERCNFLKESEKALCESLGMRNRSIYAMQLIDRSIADGKIDDEIFRDEIYLNPYATPKTLVGLLLDENNTNPYKEFYSTPLVDGKNPLSFHDVSNRSWIAKDVVKDKDSICVLEMAEKKQEKELQKLYPNESQHIKFDFVSSIMSEGGKSWTEESKKHLYSYTKPLTKETKKEIDEQIPNTLENTEFRDLVCKGRYEEICKKNGIEIQ